MEYNEPDYDSGWGEYQEKHVMSSTERFAKWRKNNIERHRSYMKRYMRERRANARVNKEPSVWCYEI